MMRRLLILLACAGLLAATAVAGYALHGYQKTGAASTLLIQRVDHRIRTGNPQVARQLLQEALAHGDITGAVLRTGHGRITVIGSTSGLGAATALGHGGSLRLATPAPLAGVSRLETFLAGLFIALAAGGLAALALLKLLPLVLRPDILPEMPRPRLPRREAPKLDSHYLARHDALTALPNRVLLQEEAQRRIMRLNGAGELALILMDLNEFKEVNDTLGHYAGDQLLRQVGERLGRFGGEQETVVARLGGDEFAIIRGGVDPVGAEQLALRVSESLRKPFLISGMTLEIDASMGIAMAPSHASDYEGLLQRADSAMYGAKRAHMGIGMHTTEQEAANRQKLALASDLRRAIEGGQLSLHYQPKAALATGNISGVEALVRWQHPERGMISPDQFIPLAERSGLINLLSMWVLKTALAQVADWRRLGLYVPASVNLSARDLIDQQLPDEIHEALGAAGVVPELLEVEITESVLMADPGRARQIVTRIGELGATTTIDDFGAGYSSLAYLKSLPVHALKIDREFVLGMTDNTHDATIVQAVVDLAHNLGLRVVAEGAEDMAVWERLRVAGCDEAQGYVLAQPMPADKATDWLVRRMAAAGAA